MSWDILIVKEKINLELDDAEIGNLGDRDTILENISKLFPNINFSDKSWGILENKDFSIEFNIGNKTIVDSIMLHIRGGGDPLNAVKLILTEMGWNAIDCQTSEFLDLKSSDHQSWKEFQNYREMVFKSIKDK